MVTADLTPRYIAIGRRLRADIHAGVYPAASAIPSETQLMSTFSTTRSTVRKAVDVLVNEGLVHRVHGKGSFVRLQPLRHSILNFGGLTDSLRGRDEVAISEVISTRHFEESGRRYVELIRLRGIRSGDSTTYLSLDTSILALDRFPGIDQVDFNVESLYATLRNSYGVHPTRLDVTLTASLPDATTARLLREPTPHQPLLEARGHVRDQRGDEVEQVRIIYSSRTDFSLTVPMSDPLT